MRLFLKEENFQISIFFQKVLRFLSLRYGADFRRSRLVFLQMTDLTLIGPLFAETTQAQSGQGKLSAKGPPFIFYFFNVTYKTGRD